MFLALIIRVVLVALGLGTGRHLSVETFMYYSESDAPLGVYVGVVLFGIKKTLFFTYFGFSSFTNYLLNWNIFVATPPVLNGNISIFSLSTRQTFC